MKLCIRQMVTSDKPALMHLLRQIPEFEQEEIVVAEEVIDSYLKAPESSGYYILASENESSLTGFISYGSTPLTKGTWDIYWIAVEPGKQGTGIGKALVVAAENEIKKRNGRLILVETSSKPSYEKTRNFYNASSYKLAGRIPDFYSTGDDLLIFEKRLT